MSLPQLPEDRSYTVEHEWVSITPGSPLPEAPVRVGITALAVDALGDLVYLDLPDVGATITAGETCGEIESTKTVSEIYPPVSGQITAINAAAVQDPSLISADPYGDGWLFEVRASAAGELLTAAQYAEHNEGQS